MMITGQDLGLPRGNRVFSVLILCLVMIGSTLWTGGDTIAMAVDEMEAFMENAHKECIPPLKKIKAAVIWDGAVTIEAVENDYYLHCAGIEAQIRLPDEETDSQGTLLFGFGGESITPEELMGMDLRTVHVNMRLTEEQTYVVRWLVVGPALTLRGRITELDADRETFTVQGITVSVTENTGFHRLRIFRSHPPIEFSDLIVGTRVRTVAHYDEEGNAYLGIHVLAAIPPGLPVEAGAE